MTKPRPGLQKLSRNFYTRPTLIVARDLPGRYLCRRLGNEIMIGRIVEVEAYLGSTDPASHAYRGRTKRNSAMFEEGGVLYVYFTYGMHFCANVVTEGKGVAAAVLLRALEPVEGMATMGKNRFSALQGGLSPLRLWRVCNGPGNLCKALSITDRENATDLRGSEIWIARGRRGDEPIGSSSRVGIRNGTTSRWRFFLKGNRYVSPGKPSTKDLV